MRELANEDSVLCIRISQHLVCKVAFQLGCVWVSRAKLLSQKLGSRVYSACAPTTTTPNLHHHHHHRNSSHHLPWLWVSRLGPLYLLSSAGHLCAGAPPRAQGRAKHTGSCVGVAAPAVSAEGAIVHHGQATASMHVYIYIYKCISIRKNSALWKTKPGAPGTETTKTRRGRPEKRGASHHRMLLLLKTQGPSFFFFFFGCFAPRALVSAFWLAALSLILSAAAAAAAAAAAVNWVQAVSSLSGWIGLGWVGLG